MKKSAAFKYVLKKKIFFLLFEIKLEGAVNHKYHFLVFFLVNLFQNVCYSFFFACCLLDLLLQIQIQYTFKRHRHHHQHHQPKPSKTAAAAAAAAASSSPLSSSLRDIITVVIVLGWISSRFRVDFSFFFLFLAAVRIEFV